MISVKQKRELYDEMNVIFTLSLFSCRLTMTAVICWSMKMRIVASIAGAIAAGIVHQALVKGLMTHPRPLQVGLNSLGTSSLGVLIPTKRSSDVKEQMVRNTPKSLMTCLTWGEQEDRVNRIYDSSISKRLPTWLGKKFVVLKFFSTTQRK